MDLDINPPENIDGWGFSGICKFKSDCWSVVLGGPSWGMAPAIKIARVSHTGWNIRFTLFGDDAAEIWNCQTSEDCCFIFMKCFASLPNNKMFDILNFIYTSAVSNGQEIGANAIRNGMKQLLGID